VNVYSPDPPPRRRSGSAVSGVLMTMLVVGMVLGLVVATHPGYEAGTIRALVTDVVSGDAWRTEDPWSEQVPVSGAPLEANGSGDYTFAMTQPGSEEPVGYDPCTVVEVVVNPEGAPDGYAEMVDVAVQRTAEATGLDLRLVGETDDRDFLERQAGDPVLIGWADEEEVPALAGETVGIGGSSALERAGVRHYVTGTVVLDVDVPRAGRSGVVAQTVLVHEFAHLVGLGHVDSPTELMHPSPVTTAYGPGDLAGLAALGSVPCR
jgi:hypothetical protein